MNRDMSSYFVAKHGVVALTRSLGVAFVFFLSDLRFNFVIKITFDYQRERGTGVEHMAICPAFAQTEVTLDTEKKCLVNFLQIQTNNSCKPYINCQFASEDN